MVSLNDEEFFMHADPAESHPKRPFTDVHDIRALTSTGTITLPSSPARVRKPSTSGPKSAPTA
jgi:hypothetical protein